MIGICDANTGDSARAAMLFGGSAGIEETAGAVWNEHWLDGYQRAVTAAREAVGGAQFAELWRGRRRDGGGGLE